MVLQECTLLSARLCVGLTMPCLVIMEPPLHIPAPSMDTPATFVKLGWTGKYQILRGREMEQVNWRESQAPLVDVSDYGRSTGRVSGPTR